jgi:hypothetical protein
VICIKCERIQIARVEPAIKLLLDHQLFSATIIHQSTIAVVTRTLPGEKGEQFMVTATGLARPWPSGPYAAKIWNDGKDLNYPRTNFSQSKLQLRRGFDSLHPLHSQNANKSTISKVNRLASKNKTKNRP